MLVFRCECEQVLGVEDDANKGRVGECPSCGRIIRVPQALVDATGKLSFHGTPSRAANAGPLREIIESPAPAQNGQSYSNGSQEKPPVFQPAAITKIIPAPLSDLGSEPVTLAPLTNEEAAAATLPDNKNIEPLEEQAPAETEEVPVPKTKTIRKVPPSRSGRAARPGSARNTPVGDDDPASAVETLNAKGMGTLAAAAAARRKRTDSTEGVPQKSSLVIYIVIGVVLLIALAAILYFAGIIGGETPPVPPPKTPATQVAPTTTTATTPATTPSGTDEKKDPAPSTDKPPETKPAEPVDR